MVNRSLDTMIWMQAKGVRFRPGYGSQAFKVNGRFKFWGGLTVQVSGGGPGLVDQLAAAAERDGIEIIYGARATELIYEDDGVRGVLTRQRRTARARSAPAPWCWPAAASSPTPNGARATSARAGMSPRCAARASTWATASAWRWRSAPCRGATGRAAHAVGWDRNAPDFGDLRVGDGFQKHSYPFGIMVNATGERFVDEGADFRNYTYAKYGARHPASSRRSSPGRSSIAR